MKKFFYLTLLLPLIAIFISCNRESDTLHPWGWSTINPQFDSLTRKAEVFYMQHGPMDSLRMAIDAIQHLAKENPSNILMNTRAQYWRARLYITEGDYDRGIELMEDCLTRTDSAKYPYDYHRYLWNLDMDYHEPSVERYRHLESELNFFLEKGDMMIAGALAMELGCFLDDLGDTEHGEPYLTMADSIFTVGGWLDQVAANRINHANTKRINRDTVGAVALNRQILNDKENPVPFYTRDIVLGNLYVLNGDTLALREAYDSVRTKSSMLEEQHLYENFLTDEALNRGDLKEARHYHELAQSKLPAVSRPDVLLEFYQNSYKLFEKEGKIDSAYKYLKTAAILNDSINTSDMEIEVREATVAQEIAKLKLEDDLERRRVTIIQLSVTFALIILIICGGIFFYRRIQRQKLEKMRADLELERSNRRMLAMELVLKEKEKLFESLSAETDKLRSAGEITPSGANRLNSSIKAHIGGNAERENFLDTFEKIDAGFASRIKAEYPALTDTDIRLAAFVALRLDNKHISRVMGIRPESVKQARWRLRTKMKLAAGASLEDAVRPFLSVPN